MSLKCELEVFLTHTHSSSLMTRYININIYWFCFTRLQTELLFYYREIDWLNANSWRVYKIVGSYVWVSIYHYFPRLAFSFQSWRKRGKKYQPKTRRKTCKHPRVLRLSRPHKKCIEHQKRVVQVCSNNCRNLYGIWIIYP